MMEVKNILFLSCLALLAYTAIVDAEIVPLEYSGWAMITTPGSMPATVSVIEELEDTVVIELRKTFFGLVVEGLSNSIIIEFQKISADAVPNIVIRQKLITNDTNAQWYDFHMSLLVDIFQPRAGFDPNSSPSGGQLENVSYAMNYGYKNQPIQLNFLDTDGKGVSSETGNDSFEPGAESGQITINTDPDMPVGHRFGLKEIASIPEPTTMVLLLGGGLITFYREKKT